MRNREKSSKWTNPEWCNLPATHQEGTGYLHRHLHASNPTPSTVTSEHQATIHCQMSSKQGFKMTQLELQRPMHSHWCLLPCDAAGNRGDFGTLKLAQGQIAMGSNNHNSPAARELPGFVPTESLAPAAQHLRALNQIKALNCLSSSFSMKCVCKTLSGTSPKLIA